MGGGGEGPSAPGWESPVPGQGSPSMRQPSNTIPQHLRGPAPLPFLLLRVRGCSCPGPQRRQPPAQPCGMVRGHRGSAQPPQLPSPGFIASPQVPPHHPNPLPAHTLSLLLQLLGPGLDFGHVALVGLQQLLWPLPVPGRWVRPPAGLSLLHRGHNGQEGLNPTSHEAWGVGSRGGCRCLPQGCGGVTVPLPSAFWKRG